MGWDNFGLYEFSVSIKSDGGERQQLAEQKLEELKEKIRIFAEQMESEFTIDGVIQFHYF